MATRRPEPRYAAPVHRVRVPAASRAPSSGLAAVLVLAQLLDLLTYSPSHELSPFVTPATALPLKVALVLLVGAVALVLSHAASRADAAWPTRFLVPARRLLLGAGIVAGALGALSNVVAAAS